VFWYRGNLLPYRLECEVSHPCLKFCLQELVKNSYVLPAKSRKMISSPIPATKARLLSFNRKQSRVVTGLLAGHNTLIRPQYAMGMSSNPNCRKCGIEAETPVHILFECEVLASLRHTHLGSFFLDPGDIMHLITGVIWISGKGTGLLMGHKRFV
jgi:hypothetical protein